MRNAAPKLPRIRRDPKRFFYRLMLTGCLCMCVPSILIGFMYYNGATEERRASIMSMFDANFRLIQNGLDDRLNNIEVESLRLAYTPLIGDAFMAPGYDERFWEHMKLLDSLIRQQYLNPILSDVIFYSVRDQFILSVADGYMRPNRYKQTDMLLRAQNQPERARWMRWTLPSGAETIAYARRLPVFKAQASDAFLIHVVMDSTLSDEISPSDAMPARVLVFSPQQELLIGSVTESEVEDINGILSASAHNGGEMGFRGMIGEENTQILCARSQLGFTYISMMPAALVDGSIQRMGLTIALLVITTIMLGVLLMYAASRYEYNPIRELVMLGRRIRDAVPWGEAKDEFGYIQQCWEALDKKAEALTKRIKQIEPTVKDVFFTKLLNNDGDWRLLAADGGFSGMRMDGGVVVIVIYPAHPGEQSHFTESDQPLLMFAVHNIADELLRGFARVSGYALDTREHGVAVIMQSPADLEDDDILKTAVGFARHAGERIEQCLAVRVSAGIGRVYAHLRDAHISYMEAIDALSLNALNETSGVFQFTPMSGGRRENSVMLYPAQQERRLVEALENGNMAQAEDALAEFQQSAKAAQSLDFLLEANHMLLAAIARSFIGKGCNLPDFLGGRIFARLHQQRSPSEIIKWFRQTPFARYEAFVSESNESSGRRAVVRICRHIRENIRMDHSLTNYADMLSMNPTYISTIFRQETGMSFVEYAHGCKVEEIKARLINTQSKIADIARELGLSERSMNRIFQKATGMTPGQYRKERGGLAEKTI
jgi:AraC-like DNA-binding protein